MKSNAEIVLRALEQGQEITLRGEIHKLIDGTLHVKCTQQWPDENNVWQSEEIWLDTDYSLSTFIKVCNGLDKDQIFLIGANTALTELRRE